MFTQMHRLIIGLAAGSLEDELVKNPDSVNTTDIDGWTPLHWAARRGNHRSLRLLLNYGADPFKVTKNEGRNALHLAAQYDCLPCVRILLQYRQGNRILDIDARDSYGDTPLRISTSHNCAAITAALIECGADLNIDDHFGETPLLGAVYENAHSGVARLLNAGADCTLKTKYGNTVLHWAANEADHETLGLLTKARMNGLHTEARNRDGVTALEVAMTRHGADATFWKSFEELLDSLGSPSPESKVKQA